MNFFDFLAANNGPQQQQGGGGMGLSHGDAMTLSLLNAMQQQAQAGTQRTASPIGSIAGALGPLLAAPIQARQMEQQSQMQQGLLALKKLGLQVQIAQLLNKGGEDEPKTIEEAIVRAQREGKPTAGLVDLKQQLQKEGNPTQYSVARDMAVNHDPAAKAIHDQVQRDDLAKVAANASAQIQAQQAGTMAVLKQLGIGMPGVEGNGGIPAGYSPPTIGVSGGKLNLTMQPPKSSPESQNIVARTQGILGMKPRVEQVLNSTPDIPNLLVESHRRLGASKLAENPSLLGTVELSALGPPNPAYDNYFQTVGELNYAMTSLATRLASRSGSAKMAVLLSPHIPQLTLQPSQNKSKVESLYGPDSVLAQEFIPEGRRAVRSGDLSPDEFGEILKGFQVINRTFTHSGKKYGVNAKNEVFPLE